MNNIKLKDCDNCAKDYQCFDCEIYEMQFIKGYTLQDDMTWQKGGGITCE